MATQVHGATTIESVAEIVTDQYGLSTGEVQFLVTNSGSQAPNSPNLGDPHPYASYMLMETRRAVRENGGWHIIGNYAGCNPSNLPNAVMEMDFEDIEDPIETHKDFNKSTFAGTPANPQNGAAFDENGKFDGFLNPAYPDFYGVTAYDNAGAIYKVTYVYPLRSVPWLGLFNEINTVLTGLPSALGTPNIPTPANRNWLVKPMSIQQRGGAVIITRSWQLSGRRGWNKIIYPST
jgi:hypothetical protein